MSVDQWLLVIVMVVATAIWMFTGSWEDGRAAVDSMGRRSINQGDARSAAQESAQVRGQDAGGW